MSAERSSCSDRAEPCTILIADDEFSQRELLSGFLSNRGYRVVEAADGAQAVERVREGGIDLVLLDQRMPRLAGIEAIRAIRTADPRVAIVVITAYGTSEDAARARAAGAVDYLEKPLDLKKLETVIHRVVARHVR